MKIWYFLILVLTLTINKGWGQTPARFIVDDDGGRVEFATASVGGIPVFSEEELSAVSSLHRFKKMDAGIIIYSPTAFEKNLAESGIKFDSLSDFRKCVDSKDYLDDKLLDLRPSEIKRKKNKIDAIRDENAKR